MSLISVKPFCEKHARESESRGIPLCFVYEAMLHVLPISDGFKSLRGMSSAEVAQVLEPLCCFFTQPDLEFMFMYAYFTKHPQNILMN